MVWNNHLMRPSCMIIGGSFSGNLFTLKDKTITELSKDIIDENPHEPEPRLEHRKSKRIWVEKYFGDGFFTFLVGCRCKLWGPLISTIKVRWGMRRPSTSLSLSLLLAKIFYVRCHTHFIISHYCFWLPYTFTTFPFISMSNVSIVIYHS